jgi:hypothetical protein
MPTHDEYWEALQAKVCTRCLDGSGDGNCRIAGDGFCAMKIYLPNIVDVVNSVYSHSVVPYEEQLRKVVCRSCTHQSAAGTCSLRDEVECALDRYFPLIVEVIEEMQKKSHLPGRT